MFELNSTIGIKTNGQSYLSLNSQVSIAPYLLTSEGYAKYILFLTSDGTLIKKETQLSCMNSDITSGTLTAEYTARLLPGEYGGESFSKFGLSFDGESFINAAEFNEVTKAEDDYLTASVTVFLTVNENDCKTLFAGDNILLKHLLGARGMDKNAFTCYAADSNLKNDAHVSYDYLKTVSYDLSCSKTENGFDIDVNLPKSAKEIVIENESQAVLRFFIYEKMLAAKMASSTVKNDFTVPLNFNDIENIANVSQNGVSINDAKFFNSFSQVFRRNDIISYNTGNDSEIKSDSYFNYLGIASAREIMFFNAKSNGNPAYLFRAEKQSDDKFDVLTGGYLAIYESGGVRIISQYGTEIFYAVPMQKDALCINEGNYFFLITADDGGNIKKYRLNQNDNGFTMLQQTSYGGAVAFFRRVNSVGVFNKTSGEIKFVDSNIEVPCENLSLTAVITQNLDGEFYFGDSLVYIKTANKTKDVLAAIDEADIIEIEKPKSCAVFSGDLFKADKNIYVFDKLTRNIVLISETNADADALAFARFKDFIIVSSRDGKTETYSIKRSGGYLYSKNFDKSKTVSITARVRKEPSSFTGNRKIGFHFTVN